MPTSRRMAQYQQPRPILSNRNTTNKVNQAVRKYGRKNLRAGTHPQQYRNYNAPGQRALKGPGALLGPMGELGDDVILEVKTNATFDLALRQRIYGREFNISNLKREFWEKVLTPLRDQTEKKIAIWTPDDSGDLINALRNSLYPSGGSSDRDFPFRIILNTAGIPYAKVVNNMPTRWLRHPGAYHRNISARTGRSLNDSTAVKGFYNITLLFARNLAKKLMKDFIATVKDIILPVVGSAQATNIAKGFFGIHFV